MNIYQIALKSHVSISTLKKLDKLGVLRAEPESEGVARMRFYLMRRQPLTVEQLLELVDEPALFLELGKYEATARVQLAALGDIRSGAAPKHVTAETAPAAAKNVKSAAVIAAWLRDVLPREPVPFAWVALRLLIGLPTALRSGDAKAMSLALLNVRRVPEFAGFFSKDGKLTVYHQFRVSVIDF